LAATKVSAKISGRIIFLALALAAKASKISKNVGFAMAA
jgi:hypothetical protein